MTVEEQVADWVRKHPVKRYGVSVKRYTSADLYALERGETETTRYRKINGMYLPIRYDNGIPEVFK